jgi:hypothetical protein
MNLINRKTAASSFLLLISSMVAIVAFEFLLRALGIVIPVQNGWKWDDMPFQKYKFPDSQTNQLGFKGSTIEYSNDDTVIVLLGDSQVESAALPMRGMPESILEKTLVRKSGGKIKVFTLGSSGWGLDQQLLALKEYLSRYHADYIIQWATPQNDLWETAFSDRSTGTTAGPIKPTFFLKSDKLISPEKNNQFFIGGLAITQLALTKFGLISAGEYIKTEWDNAHFKNWTTPNPNQNCNNLAEISQFEFQPFRKNLPKSINLTTTEAVSKGRSHFFNFIQSPSAMGTYQKDLAATMYSELSRTAQNHGAKFLAFYPHRELDNSYARVKCISETGGASYNLKYDPEGVLRQILGEIELINVDIHGENEIAVSADDAHLNELGNTRAMNALADILNKRIATP